MKFRVFFFLALLFFSSSLFKVTRGNSEPDTEAGDIGIVADDVQDIGDVSYSPAPGVNTAFVFPKNPSKSLVAGEENEVLIGIHNEGETTINIVTIQAAVHLPYDHRYLVQNLSSQVFNNSSVPPASQATFPYVFAVSKFLQPGAIDLVGKIFYEIDQNIYQNTFYNGTIEVTEASGPLSIESVFLVSLAIAGLFILFFWVRGQIQHISKKAKRAPLVEVGTRKTDASMDEWLQGTAYTQSASSKSKKKK